MSHETELSHAREVLRRQREDLFRRRASLQEQRAEVLDHEDSPEYVDRATRSESVSTIDQLTVDESRELRAIDGALARIEAGTYGLCSDCGEPIERARLEAMPEAALCIVCRERREREANERGRAHSGSALP